MSFCEHQQAHSVGQYTVFFKIHFSNVLHSFLSNEMVLYDRNAIVSPQLVGYLKKAAR